MFFVSDLAQFQGFEGFAKRIGMHIAHFVSPFRNCFNLDFRFSSILPLYSSIHQFQFKKIGSQCVLHTSQMPRDPYFACSNEFSLFALYIQNQQILTTSCREY